MEQQSTSSISLVQDNTQTWDMQVMSTIWQRTWHTDLQLHFSENASASEILRNDHGKKTSLELYSAKFITGQLCGN